MCEGRSGKKWNEGGGGGQQWWGGLYWLNRYIVQINSNIFYQAIKISMVLSTAVISEEYGSV